MGTPLYMGSEDILVFAPSKYKVKYTNFRYLLKYSSYWDGRPLILSARPTFLFVFHTFYTSKMTGSALKTPKRVKMARKWQNPISHEPIFVESWLTPHSVRKTHFSISVLYYKTLIEKWFLRTK